MAKKPKKPAKPKSPALSPEELAARRLDRNVSPRNVGDVILSSDDYRSLLTDADREAEAVEMLRRHAIESDPSKPGYEANEVISPLVRAFTQLPSNRRTSLLAKAGNPELFTKLPQGYDPLGPIPEDVAAQVSADAESKSWDEVISEAVASGKKRSHSKKTYTPEELDAMRGSLATHAGSTFAENHKPETIAPIDRDSKGAQYPDEKAIQDIERIVGVPMWKQFYNATKGSAIDPKVLRGEASPRPGRADVALALPSVEAPTYRSVNALDKRLSNKRGLLSGASSQAEKLINEDIERISGLGVDPEMEPFGHVVDTRFPIDADQLNSMRANADIERATARREGDPQPLSNFLEDAEAGRSINLEDPRYAGLPPGISSSLFMNKLVSPPLFSDAAPTAVPDEGIKTSMVERLRDNLAEIKRRQAAFAANPADAAIGQRDNIDTLTVGTLGLQEPYDPRRGRFSQTVDQQLQQSVQSGRDRLLEAIYRANPGAFMDAPQVELGDFGKDDILRRSDTIGPSPGDMASRVKSIPLDALLHEWRYQFGRPAADGTMEYPAQAPSAQFLADYIIDRYGVEDPDEFRRVGIPVLEKSIAEQHMTLPQGDKALAAARTRLVPSMRSGSKGREFFTQPGAEERVSGMFDERYPMPRFEPSEFSQTPGGAMPVPQQQGPIDFQKLLNDMDGESAGEIDLNEVFRRLPEAEDLGQTMNRNRSGLLHGLYA